MLKQRIQSLEHIEPLNKEGFQALASLKKLYAQPYATTCATTEQADVGEMNLVREGVVTPERLQKARARLVKVPVNFALSIRRPKTDSSGLTDVVEVPATFLQGLRRRKAFGDTPHGFVALGRPGVKGAKTFTVTGQPLRSGASLNEASRAAVNNYNPQDGNGGPVYDFKPDIRQAIKKMPDQDFPTFEAFHAAYRQARIDAARLNNNAGPTEREIKEEIFALFNVLEKGDWQEIALYRPNHYFALQDTDTFEKEGRYVQVSKVKDLKATDVIEAAQQLNLAQLYLDEKFKRAGAGLTPTPKELQDKEEDDALNDKEFIANNREETKNLLKEMETAAAHNPTALKGDAPQPAPAAVKERLSTYHYYLPAKAEPNVSFIVRRYVNKRARNRKAKAGPDTRPDEYRGNCTSSSASMLRLAGELKNRTVRVKAPSSFGVYTGHQTTLWNPVRAKMAERRANSRLTTPSTDSPEEIT